jgi:thioredoxin
MRMKRYVFFVFVLLFNSCGNAQKQLEQVPISAAAFAEKTRKLPQSPIVDVRTPEEFAKGHLPTARNIDWNGSDFEAQIQALDKSKPVFIYCLSGGRSASAAKKMCAEGFQVYEMAGGIMKWRAAGLPEIKNTSLPSDGMTLQQFQDLVPSDKVVLVDFYADWCGPCKKMKPYLEEISKDLADKVVVVRINADDHQSLCKALKIDALPVLQVYKKGIVTWTNTGFIEKSEVLKHL